MAKYIIPLIFFGSLILLLFVFALVALMLLNRQKTKSHQLEVGQLQFVNNMKLLEAIFEAQEEVMKSLSQEIHDNICQVLSGTKMQLATMERMRSGDQPLSQFLAEMGSQLGKTLNDLRDLSHTLNNDMVLTMGIMESIDKELELFCSVYDLDAELQMDSTFPELTRDQEVMLFRIIQGVLLNVVKHAEATKVCLRVWDEEGLKMLSIKDNGRGIDCETARNGLGLLNFEQRIKILGGSMELLSSLGNGTELIFKFNKLN